MQEHAAHTVVVAIREEEIAVGIKCGGEWIVDHRAGGGGSVAAESTDMIARGGRDDVGLKVDLAKHVVAGIQHDEMAIAVVDKAGGCVQRSIHCKAAVT